MAPHSRGCRLVSDCIQLKDGAGEGAGAKVFDGLRFAVGFHGGFEVLDQALLAAGVAEGSAVFFVGVG